MNSLQLESFLDRKLKRKFSTKATIPSFLTEDEDLQDAPEAQLPQGGQGEGFDDALSHASIHSSTVSTTIPFDLDTSIRSEISFPLAVIKVTVLGFVEVAPSRARNTQTPKF